MKQLLIGLAATGLLLSAVGCGDDSSSTDTTVRHDRRDSATSGDHRCADDDRRAPADHCRRDSGGDHGRQRREQ